MKILGLTLARAGSTAVKQKNIRPLCGKPLMAYAIENALNSNIDRLIVSTDCEEYARVARQYGAEVPFLRPANIAGAEATAISGVRHALSWLEAEEGYRPDAVALLPATAPFRTTDTINKVLESYDGTSDSVVTVRESADHPYYIFQRNEDSTLVDLVQMDNKPERRQDMPVFFSLCQTVYLSSADYLMAPENDRAIVVNLKSMKSVVVDTIEAFDINTEADLQMAEALMQQRQGALEHA